MNTDHRKSIAWLTTALALTLAATLRADTLVNNFTTSFDYVATGIIGDPNWDGVYLGFGDIPGGTATIAPGGSSQIANSTTFPGYLGVRSINNGWSGAEDDGFFLYKVVKGDFDVSVQTAPYDLNGGVTYDNGADNFAGLMVRAYNTNYSGSPFSTTTNASENYVMFWRFDEFDFDGEVRVSTNSVNFEYTYPEGDTNSALSTTRYYRITRTGNVFNFFTKTNAGDAWIPDTNNLPGGNLVRSDWTGVALQVGIAQADFNSVTHDALFTDFELSGTNVSIPSSMPAGPTGLTVSSPTTNGTLTFSWTTNGGNGSVLIVRKITPANGVLIANPIQGVDYTGFAGTNFQTANTLIAGETHVVYAGSATSVTVGGLGGSNNVYLAEVVSYDSVSQASIVYNTAAPATTSFLGPGVPASISVSVFPTTIPVGGAGQIKVFATFNTGEQVDVTTDPSVTLTSSDSSTLSVGNGILNALQAGTVSLTTTYAAFASTNSVTNVPPDFTDNFNVPRNYLTNGLPGSGWDGIYIVPGDLEGATGDGGAVAFATAVDADISSNNTLTVSAGGTSWEGASDNGFYLFKNMPGDFEAVVHVDLSAHGSYQFAGLIARAAGPNGAPPATGEDYVANWFFDQFSVVSSARETIDGVYQGPNDTDGTTPINTMWLLLQRVNGTNFYCYTKADVSLSWNLAANASLVEPELTNGVPVQIGLAQSTYTASPAETVRFDSFMLSGPGLVASPAVPVPPAVSNFTMVFNPDTSMTLSWYDPIADDGTAPAVARSFVVMRAGAPVSAQPSLGSALAGNSVFGDPANDLGGHNYVVYRTASGDTNQNQQVTVTGLSPGTVYYAAVYTFSGLGTTRTFNTATSAATTTQDGNLIGIETSLVGGAIPAGGVGFVKTTGIFSGGGFADVSAASTIILLDTNVVVATNGILTGLTNGTTIVDVTVGGFTNSLMVTVRAPSFTDNFGVSHDYLANGVAGTSWDGIYDEPSNTIPDKTYVSAGAATLDADANISTNGCLTVTNINAGFEFNQDDGFFLFKYVPGDFQMAVDLANYTNNGAEPYNCSGLMVRAYTEATNGTLGAPLDGDGNECWLSWERFDEFGNGSRYEYTVDNNTTRPFNSDVNSPEHYLLMVRQNSTNFYFFLRQFPTDPWHTTSIGNLTGGQAATKFAGLPLQAGILVAGFDSGLPVNVSFSNFLLDVSPTELTISNSSAGIVVSWPGSPGVQLQSTTSLTPADWQPVTGTPVFANGLYSLTLPAGPSQQFFRLKQ